MKNSPTSGSVRARSLEDAAAHQSPLTARQVLEHQQPERAEGHPQAEQKPDQPRAEELLGVGERADDAGRERDAAHNERPLLQPVQHGSVGNREVCRHFSCTGAPAGLGTRVGSPPGTSAVDALWLNCSARMYATMFQRSRGAICAR